jgi:iron complex transport system substrate-binding protein
MFQIISQKEVFLRSVYKAAVLLVLFFSCAPEKKEGAVSPKTVVGNSGLRYAKRFASASSENCRLLYLFGDRNSKDTTATFILYPKGTKKPEGFKKAAFYVEVPVKNVACLSSVYAAMLTKLGLQSSIVAIDNSDYYNTTYILKKVEEGTIKELAKGPEMNVEQTLLLKPDLILTFGMGYPEKDVNAKILSAQIPVAISLDHLEETPLARA